MSLTEPPRVARQDTRPKEDPKPRQPVHSVLWLLVGLIIGIEALQQAAEAGLVPQIFQRWVIYSAFAFFDADFERALAGGGVSLQLLWSTLTHAFLHANWLHLALNMAAFLGIGHAIIQGIGLGRFLAVFALCAIAGAVTLGLVSDVRGPLVGASGAVFGFLGVITAWQERMLARRGLSRRAVWQRIAGLVAINVVLAIGMGGLLAWEAHLGGFAAGWILGLAWPPKATIRLPF